MRTTLGCVAALVLAGGGCRGNDASAGTGPYAREIAAAIPKIEETVGLRFKAPPRVEARTKEQVRAFIEAKLNEPEIAAQLAGEEAALRRFGMIPDTMQLRPFMLELYAEQVAGYYDPRTKVLYVVEGATPEIASLTVSHELVHALQDQYLNLDSLQHMKGDADRVAAAQAVVEGQATYESMQMAFGGNIAAKIPGGWEEIRRLIREQSTQLPIISRAPLAIQESLVFPYLSGAEFVRRLKEGKPTAVPFDRMPTSTEQVMHPAAYESTPPDNPVSITLPAPNGATRVHDDVLGEFGTRLFLYEHLRDQAAAVRGAAGWDGDRYMVVRTPRGDGIVWLSVWDTPLDAGEFGDLAKQALARRYGRPVERTVAGGTEYDLPGRALRVTGGELRGRAYVLYVDVPAGVSRDLVTVTSVQFRD